MFATTAAASSSATFSPAAALFGAAFFTGQPQHHASPAPVAGPLGWPDLLAHRDYLVRFARRKLQDPSLAEDVVHDVFEAVVSGQAQFGGRAALRSWLTAVLKNKIIDLIRQRARYDSLDADDSEDENGAASSVNQLASEEAGPHDVAEQRERLSQTLARIAQLPQSLRDVIEYRVMRDESSQEVCERLAISEASLFVRLHRARKQLVC
jgi:RNA polymerase sigma-70 factor, ECF subfamily